MNAKLALRQVDLASSALRNDVLASGLDGIKITYLDDPMKYVAFKVGCGAQVCRTYVPAQQLIDLWLGKVTIAIEHIEPDIAVSFMREALRTQGLPEPADWFQWQAVEGFARAADALDPVLHLPADGFDCYVDRLPTQLRNAAFLRSDFPVDIRWVLPAGELSTTTLAGLQPGDVLCPKRQRGTLYAGTIPIFSFQIQDDFLMLEEEQNAPLDDMFVGDSYKHDDDAQATHVPQSTEAQSSYDDLAATPQSSLNLEALPVAVSFVLGKRSMTVAEISSLCAGMTLSLDVVTPHVDVVVGGTLLARGELVRLGDQLAVEIGTITATVNHPVDAP